MCAFKQDRVPIPEEPLNARQKSFVQILDPYTEDEAVIEAQRCLQCAMPYCVQACPITQDCRGYIDLIAKRKFDEAARLTVRDNPLSTVLCKTCYHFCEEDCVKGGRGTPIAIRHLKRAALEFGNADLTYVPKPPNGDKVAVVGGGPAGLMAAWDLALRGYAITLFEEKPFLGGQMDTIPKYHLQGDEIAKDLARFRDLSIDYQMGKQAGKDFTPETLLAQGYAAVYLALGANAPRHLNIPGEELPGVFYALPFLLGMNVGDDGLLGRKERKVVIVGGGDVALDAARSSLRISAPGDVTLVYRRGETEMPASEEEKIGGDIEGVNFLYSRSPVEIVGKGHVEGLVVRQTTLGPPDAQGRRAVVDVPGTDATLPCDTIVIAAGETPDMSGLPKDLHLAPSRHGWPEGGGPQHMTAVPGVFASGSSSVVKAMEAGAQAAEAIDAFVSQSKGRPPTPRPDPLGGATPPDVPSGYGGPSWQL